MGKIYTLEIGEAQVGLLAALEVCGVPRVIPQHTGQFLRRWRYGVRVIFVRIC
jgi:hypothetical protein